MGLFALLIMWLWNWIVPDLFHLQNITFWQAFALNGLTTVLFKPSSALFQIRDAAQEVK